MKDRVNTQNTRENKNVEAFNNICKQTEHTLRTVYPTDNNRHKCYDPATKKVTNIKFQLLKKVKHIYILFW